MKRPILIFLAVICSLLPSLAQSKVTLQANFTTFRYVNDLPFGNAKSYRDFSVRPSLLYSYGIKLTPRLHLEPTFGINQHRGYENFEQKDSLNGEFWNRNTLVSLSLFTFLDFSLSKRFSIGIGPGVYFNVFSNFEDERGQGGAWTRFGKLTPIVFAAPIRVGFCVNKFMNFHLGYSYDITTNGYFYPVASTPSLRKFVLFTGLQFTIPKYRFK